MKMNLLKTIAASLMLAAGAFAANAYEAVTATYGSTAARKLTSFALTDGSHTQSFQVGQTTTSGASIYFDKTSLTAFETTPGATVSISALNWSGYWMNGFLYIDYGNDDSFSTTLNTGTKDSGDVVSYSSMDDSNENGHDSKGNQTDRGQSGMTASSMPSFTIPSDLPGGIYTARFKVDWSDLNPAGNTGIGGNGGCVVDFKIKVVSAVSRTITVESADETKGTVAIVGETGTTVTKAGAVTVTATASEHYQFDNWTNKTTGAVVSTENPFNYSGDDDITLVANFVDKTYPEMKRYYTQATTQQNRYLAKVTTNSETTPTVFEAKTQDELHYTLYASEFGEDATGVADGAVIDLTNSPIEISTDINNSFDMTYYGYTEAIGGNGSQLHWTQQAVFIDWNDDKDFLDDNEIYAKSSNTIGNDNGVCASFISTTGYTRTITIPTSVDRNNKTYRMRVIYYEPKSDNSEQWQNTIFTDKNCKIRNGVAYDFTIRFVAANPRTVTVKSSDSSMGTVAIEGTEESSVTTIDDVTVTATSTDVKEYIFSNWTNEETGAVVSTSNPYTYTSVDPITLVANFVVKTYPVMQRSFDATNQQNRYLAKVTATVGNHTQNIFEATTEGELPYTQYTTASTCTSDGAIIDLTEKPIEVGNEASTFDMNFISWLTALSTNSSWTCQMDWTQQAVFIDWDNDKEFAGTDEIYEKSSDALGHQYNDVNASFIAATGYTRTGITIPEGIERNNKTYRMRVVYHEPLNNETARTEHWQDTFFTANNGVGKMRNGIAYDFAVMLTDKETGVETVNGAEAAKVVAGANSISVIGDAETIDVYTTGGAIVSHNEANVNCAAGLYIVKVDGNVTKVLVK